MVEKGCNVPLLGSLSQLFPMFGLGTSRGKGYPQQPPRQQHHKQVVPSPQRPTGSFLIIRIRYSALRSYPPPRAIHSYDDAQLTLGRSHPLPPFTRPDYLIALGGQLPEFHQFTHTENAGWLISIAHDLFDPLERRGSLGIGPLLHGPPSLQESQQPTDHRWREVSPNDPVFGAIYEYAINANVFLLPTKRSLRHGRSQTATANASSADTMRRHVLARDHYACTIFRFPQDPQDPWAGGLINSHLIPKRMGDIMTASIIEIFGGGSRSNIGSFSPAVGLALSPQFDSFVDTYRLGFRYFENTGEMEIHVFPPFGRQYCINAAPQTARNSEPLVHHYRVPRNQAYNNIPAVEPAALRWHYLQCVILHFGTDAYKALPNIAYYELPMRMDGEDDEWNHEDPSSNNGQLWPSHQWDTARANARFQAEQNERQKNVVDWLSAH